MQKHFVLIKITVVSFEKKKFVRLVETVRDTGVLISVAQDLCKPDPD